MTSQTRHTDVSAHPNRAMPARFRPRPLGLPAAIDAATLRIGALTPTALRVTLALLFVWFGVLKIIGASPVAALISATLPWANPHLAVGALGTVEIILGLGLLTGRLQRLFLVALAAHLSGTFLAFVMAPALTMQHGNPLLLTTDGEFVLKNLVLISAALLLAAQAPRGRAAH